MKEVDTCLDSQLWHACAGGMVQMPLLNSRVFYFPQGHAEHTQASLDFVASLRIPALILCRVVAVKFLADPETDEVYANLRLIPVGDNEMDYVDDEVLGCNGPEISEKPVSFAKTLTQSDANNGGGFSVPRYCAETIFPRLNYSADPPVQTVIAKDIHGDIWKFRHIYRGTPRRHLLTTGWSSFVNQKKLIAGDSIVFLRAENGELSVGIRRAKRGIGGDTESPPSNGWNSMPGNSISTYGGFSMLLKEDESKLLRNGYVGMNLNSTPCCGDLRGTRRRLRPESVIEATSLAASGQPFDVVYYPRASTPDFCVNDAAVKAAMQIQWYPGMRFKMPFETEDSSRLSWFMGTISSVQVADPISWPNSLWRLLQVTWDEPDLLQNVKRVSPWLVELVPNMPVMHMSPFSQQTKKSRLSQYPEFPFDGQFPLLSFSGNPHGPSSRLCCLSGNTPAGIQGARHSQFGKSLSDFHHSFQRFDPNSRFFDRFVSNHTKSNDNISCLLTMGLSTQNMGNSGDVKRPHFLLFGQPIFTEQQISRSRSSDTVSQVLSGKCSSEENFEKGKVLSIDSGSPLAQKHRSANSTNELFSWPGIQRTEVDIDTKHCMVFMESKDVGQTLDLSVLGSYEDLYRRLAKMFGLKKSESLNRVIYRDATGALKQVGDEQFSEFMTTAKRLTVLTDASNDNEENV